MANNFPLLSEMGKITNAELKLHWAKHHLDLLDSEVALFLNGHPYTVSCKDDLEAGEYVISCAVGSLPVHLVLILGDFISALRSSLDHLAGLLTNIPNGTPSLKASFPIIGVADKEGLRLFDKSVAGIPPSAIAVIRSFQPYQRGDLYKATKLWKLNRLWNIDKHRRIPHHSLVAKIHITFPPSVKPIASGANNSGVVRFRLSDKPHVNLDPSIEIVIQFGDESEGIIVATHELVDIYEFVSSEVFPAFECFF
jgi:hypothetical protein